MNNKSIKFNFIQSNPDILSGIALKEGEGIVASFKLKIHVDVKPQGVITLKFVLKPSGNEVYKIFNKILLKYGEKHIEYMEDGHLFSRWKIPYNKLEEALEDVRETLAMFST